MKYENISVSIMSTLGIAVSLADFKTYLDIILIIISILNITIIFIIRMIKYSKDGKIDEHEKQDLINDIQTLQNTINHFEEKLKDSEEETNAK